MGSSHLFRGFLIAVVLFCAGDCGTSPGRPSSPSSINIGFPGSWAGTLVDAQSGSGTVALTLSGFVPDIASGLLTVSVAGVSTSGTGSVLRGSSNFHCGSMGGAVGTLVVDGDSMTGTLSFVDCAPFTKVTLQAQRQPK